MTSSSLTRVLSAVADCKRPSYVWGGSRLEGDGCRRLRGGMEGEGWKLCSGGMEMASKRCWGAMLLDGWRMDGVSERETGE